MWRILPTYRSVRAQISSWPQGFSTRTGFCSAMFTTSPGRHHHGRAAYLALDVAAEAGGGVLVLEGADADTVPDALAAEVGFDHVRLEACGPRLVLHPEG